MLNNASSDIGSKIFIHKILHTAIKVWLILARRFLRHTSRIRLKKFCDARIIISLPIMLSDINFCERNMCPSPAYLRPFDQRLRRHKGIINIEDAFRALRGVREWDLDDPARARSHVIRSMQIFTTHRPRTSGLCTSGYTWVYWLAKSVQHL